MLKTILIFCLLVTGFQARALELDVPLISIEGGSLSLASFSGQPILVVNTASRCGFTDQYRGLQDLYDRYRDQGLVVVAVPSNDFRQELSTNEEVKDFCELQYGIDMPMTAITRIKGPDAHPFYLSLKNEAGFTPRWNFNKVLIGPDGGVVDTFGSNVAPLAPKITQQIEALLPGS